MQQAIIPVLANFCDGGIEWVNVMNCSPVQEINPADWPMVEHAHGGSLWA